MREELVLGDLQAVKNLLESQGLDLHLLGQVAGTRSNYGRSLGVAVGQSPDALVLEAEVAGTVVLPELAECLDGCVGDLEDAGDDSPAEEGLFFCVEDHFAATGQREVRLLVAEVEELGLAEVGVVLAYLLVDVEGLLQFWLATEQFIGVVAEPVVLFLAQPHPSQEGTQLVLDLLLQLLRTRRSHPVSFIMHCRIR